MSRRLLTALSLLLFVALVAGACAAPAAAPAAETGAATSTEAGPAATTETTTEAGSEPLKVLLFINGTLGDKSFFDSAKRGVDQAASELGVEVDTVEATYDATQWEPALVDSLANGDYDVIAEKTDLEFESVWLAPRGSL